MAVYEIDGKRYQSDTPLTDAELEELSGKAASSMGAVVAESARKGFASSVGTTSGLSNLLFSALERIGINPLTMGMKASGGTVAPAPTEGGIIETFKAGRQPVYKSVMESLVDPKLSRWIALTALWTAVGCSSLSSGLVAN